MRARNLPSKYFAIDGEVWSFSDATATGDADLEAAYVRAIDRLAVILKQAGVSWDDVVDITTFNTDLKTQMPAIMAVKNRYVRAPFRA